MLRKITIGLALLSLLGCSTDPTPPESSIRLNFSVKRSNPPNDSLLPVFPNPFNRINGDTNLAINFNLRDSGSAIVLVQNALGDEIAGFSDTLLEPGLYSGRWNPLGSDGTRLNAGLYFITLRTNTYINSRLVNIQDNE